MKTCRNRLAALATALFLGTALVPALAPTAYAASPTRFTVQDAGTPGKPDIVLVPGLSSSRNVWAETVAALGPNYRLHLVQIDGFGGAPASENAKPEPLLPAIVAQLHDYIASSHMHPAVIGHSLGGLLGLMLADEHPDDVSKLVVVDATPFVGLTVTPTADVHNIQPIAQMMRDGARRLSPADREKMEQQTAIMFSRSEDGRQRIMKDATASDPDVSARAMYEDMQTDLRPQVASIRTPTLVLFAADPTLVYPNGIHATGVFEGMVFRKAYEGMPNLKLVEIDDSRHFVMYDQPQRFQQEISQFLDTP